MGKRTSKGLGDSIEKFTETTGIKAGVDKLAEAIGFDCGCDKRKEVLNKLFPYNKPECLSIEDYNYLTDFYAVNHETITPMIQKDLSDIYYNVFGVTLSQTSCDSCWRDTIGKLRKVYMEHDNEA
jgi:hypothetical protein